MIKKVLYVVIVILFANFSAFSQSYNDKKVKFKLKINHDSSICINNNDNSEFYNYLLNKYGFENSTTDKNPNFIAYVNCTYLKTGKLDSIHVIGLIPAKIVENTLEYFESIDEVSFKGIKYKEINIGFVIKTLDELGNLIIIAKILKTK